VHASPAFSPDGMLLLYGATPASSLPQLYIQNVASGLVRKLTDDASIYYRDAVWSPDGTQIAFAAANQGEFEDLYVMDSDGTNVVRLTETPELSEIWLAWSPDGETLVYVERDAELAYRLAVIPAAGGASSPLGEPPLAGTTPKWSHDGSRVFFVSRDLDAKTASLMSVAADGSDPQTLLTLTATETTTPGIDSLDVSPDGSLVAFIQSDFVTGDAGFTIQSSLHLLDPITGELTSPVWITDDVWAGALDFKPEPAS
jgi:Tol biopolymer transport system component